MTEKGDGIGRVLAGIGTFLVGVAAILALFLGQRGSNGEDPVAPTPAIPNGHPQESKDPKPVVPTTVEVLRLTPELGEGPRLSGTLVDDGICPAGYDRQGATIPSEPGYIGVAGTMSFKTPDGRETSNQRGFLTFAVAQIRDSAEIQAARLSMPIGGISGRDVYEEMVLVEQVDIGRSLEVSDYARGGLLIANTPVAALEARPGLDVTKAVRRAFQRRADFVTVRLRFPYDNGRHYFNGSQGGTLEVKVRR